MTQGNKVYYFLGFGVFTMVILGIDLLLLPKLFNKKFIEEKWKIKHEILWNIWLLLSLAGGYYGLVCITDILPVNYVTIINLLLLAVLPVIILIIINQNVALRNYLKNIMEMNIPHLSSSAESSENINIHRFISQNKKEKLEINLNDLLYFSSTGNYIQIVWGKNDEIRKEILRGTLEENLLSLNKYDFIEQTHRSYVVNIRKIENILGNSKHGYRMRLKQTNDEIPVSRKYIKKIKILHSEGKTNI